MHSKAFSNTIHTSHKLDIVDEPDCYSIFKHCRSAVLLHATRSLPAEPERCLPLIVVTDFQLHCSIGDFDQ